MTEGQSFIDFYRPLMNGDSLGNNGFLRLSAFLFLALVFLASQMAIQVFKSAFALINVLIDAFMADGLAG